MPLWFIFALTRLFGEEIWYGMRYKLMYLCSTPFTLSSYWLTWSGLSVSHRATYLTLTNFGTLIECCIVSILSFDVVWRWEDVIFIMRPIWKIGSLPRRDEAWCKTNVRLTLERKQASGKIHMGRNKNVLFMARLKSTCYGRPLPIKIVYLTLQRSLQLSINLTMI